MNPSDCCNSGCDTVPPVNVPGSAGAPGEPGAAGAAGAAGPNTVTVATTTNLTGYLTGDGANIGVQAVPIPLIHGGTQATTKALAQVSLGLGQDIIQINNTALAYAITAPTPATIGATMFVTVIDSGLYLILGWACVEFRGATFTVSRVITLKARNTTTNTDLSTAVKTTGVPAATITYPSDDYHIPFVAVTLAAGDIVALQIGIDVVQSAGTSQVTEASLAIIPLALA